MSFSAESPPPGWYPDPAGSGGERYWDGGTWSQVTRPAGGMAAGAPQQQAQSAPYPSYGQGGYGSATQRQPVLAGFWWRVLAAVLDSLIVLVPFSVVVFLVAQGPIAELTSWWDMALEGALAGNPNPPPTPDGALFYISLLTAFLWFLYRTALVALRGATLGQSITGLRVLRDGDPIGTNPSWGVSAVRALAAVVFQQIPLVSIVDPLTMLFTAKKQTIHDLLARTVVLKK